MNLLPPEIFGLICRFLEGRDILHCLLLDRQISRKVLESGVPRALLSLNPGLPRATALRRSLPSSLVSGPLRVAPSDAWRPLSFEIFWGVLRAGELLFLGSEDSELAALRLPVGSGEARPLLIDGGASRYLGAGSLRALLSPAPGRLLVGCGDGSLRGFAFTASERRLELRPVFTARLSDAPIAHLAAAGAWVAAADRRGRVRLVQTSDLEGEGGGEGEAPPAPLESRGETWTVGPADVLHLALFAPARGEPVVAALAADGTEAVFRAREAEALRRARCAAVAGLLSLSVDSATFAGVRDVGHDVAIEHVIEIGTLAWRAEAGIEGVRAVARPLARVSAGRVLQRLVAVDVEQGRVTMLGVEFGTGEFTWNVLRPEKPK